ncbi:hypothetical protein [Methylobacterium sp. yr668]|uniref:hypothetical protein n=1 Tax=Methylobacterium sp. yr668 TaxID=1761801 RepID=UPI000B83E35F|nr:hypothetical protein [Methylobacterium sp. yr668]
MKFVFPATLALALLAGPVLAQGNSPYNRSGPQAGGPLAGQEREMGASGGTPAVDPPRPAKPAARTKRRKHLKHRHGV